MAAAPASARAVVACPGTRRAGGRPTTTHPQVIRSSDAAQVDLTTLIPTQDPPGRAVIAFGRSMGEPCKRAGHTHALRLGASCVAQPRGLCHRFRLILLLGAGHTAPTGREAQAGRCRSAADDGVYRHARTQPGLRRKDRLPRRFPVCCESMGAWGAWGAARVHTLIPGPSAVSTQVLAWAH